MTAAILPVAPPKTPASGSQAANNLCRIKDVWAYNLFDEMSALRTLAKTYKYLAMDTEFPGIVARPIGTFRQSSEYIYNVMRSNVDLLKIIQLGLTLFDDEGKVPEGAYTTWQFNFKFSLSEDMYAQDSIDLLTHSQIQFKKHEEDGIDPFQFACLLFPTGIVLNDEMKWITFHSSFDFGYLYKVLMNSLLPENENNFLTTFSMLFPKVYDVKYLIKSCKNLRGGLQEIADQLELQRVGLQHQAGSDSLLTGLVFFKIKEMYFEGFIDDTKYCGYLYGLGAAMLNGDEKVSEKSETESST